MVVTVVVVGGNGDRDSVGEGDCGGDNDCGDEGYGW